MNRAFDKELRLARCHQQTATHQLPPTNCHQPIVTNQLPPTNCNLLSPPLCRCDLRGRRGTCCSPRGRMYALGSLGRRSCAGAPTHQPPTNHQPTTNQSPPTTNHQPPTTHQPPTNHQLQPTTTDHQPLTNHHQPPPNHHQLSAPVSGEIVRMWGYPVL